MQDLPGGRPKSAGEALLLRPRVLPRLHRQVVQGGRRDLVSHLDVNKLPQDKAVSYGLCCVSANSSHKHPNANNLPQEKAVSYVLCCC